MNQLTEEQVAPLPMSEHMKGVGDTMRGFARDEDSGTIWVYSGTSIWEVVVRDEDRDVWKHYLRREQFESALHFCIDESQRDSVLRAQAEHYFSQGKITLAGVVLALLEYSVHERYM